METDKNNSQHIFYKSLAVFFLCGFSCFWHADNVCLGEEKGPSEEESGSFWKSKPTEIYEADLQVLDKISGKVFHYKLKINEPIAVGDLTIVLKRCFRNDPSENREIYAFIEVYEKKKYRSLSDLISKDKFGNVVTDKIKGNKLFAKYLFASSPGINKFIHPVYDIRAEFPANQ